MLKLHDEVVAAAAAAEIVDNTKTDIIKKEEIWMQRGATTP